MKVGTFPFRANGRALATNETDGFAEVIVDAESHVFRLIVIGYILLVFGLLCMILTLLLKSLFLLLLTTIFIGLGNGPSFAGGLAYLNQVSTDAMRANGILLFLL
ncbi:hypothetical protein [Ammoniphilus sp. 3BR4]|uniref:hypothetical protein n=1 Tax=Ammoniphilus sp. 3BR4 TaxID=3158265 RepID=UPI003466E9AE